MLFKEGVMISSEVSDKWVSRNESDKQSNSPYWNFNDNVSGLAVVVSEVKCIRHPEKIKIC